MEKIKETNEDIEMRNAMEKMVNSYDSYMKMICMGREKTLRERTINSAQVKPGDCVLEVGCGTGTLTLTAKRKAGSSGKVFGIDQIPGMVEVSKKKAEQAGLDITFQQGSIDKIPFKDNMFDVVISSFMIFHMSEKTRNKGISEIYRVLKPGGRLFILDMAMPENPVALKIVKTLLKGMDKHDLHELFPVMKKTGFSDVEFSRLKFRLFGFSLLAFVQGKAGKK